MSAAPDMGRAALWYARRGIYVIPLHVPLPQPHPWDYVCTCEVWRHSDKCKAKSPHWHLAPGEHCDSAGKHPRVAKWETEATTDEATIAAWWRQWPAASVGIAAGKSGLIILDADTYKESAGAAALLTEHDELTVTVVSGGGGRHLWFRMPEGARWTNSKGRLPEGIDVRGWGGQAVAPPSLHKSGARYSFLPGRSLADLEPATVPDWLATMLERAQESGERRPAAAQPRPADAPTPGGELFQLRVLLDHIAAHRADDYTAWVTVGMAIKQAAGDAGFALWDSWSARSAKYDPDATRRKWDTFAPDGRLTVRSLVHLAQEDGSDDILC